MSKDEGDGLLVAEIGDPVPGEDALDPDDDILAIGLDGLQERLRGGVDVLVEPDFALVVDDTDVHGSGVQIDAAIEGVGAGVESHWGLLPVENGWHHPAYPEGALGRRPQ